MSPVFFLFKFFLFSFSFVYLFSYFYFQASVSPATGFFLGKSDVLSAFSVSFINF